LGEATVRMLADAGANVVIADINDEAGEKLAAELGDKCFFSRTDVTNETDVQRAVDLCQVEFGGLQGAVACAGILIPAKILSSRGVHSVEAFRKVIEVNLVGSFNLLRLAANLISEGEENEGGERGIIVVTSSIAADEGQLGQISYSASKAGVVGMILPAARELARHGIRVAGIAPGIFETPMMAGLSDKVRDSLAQQVPFPSRLGKPDEYAAAVKYIIENTMLNGTVIRLDGAMRMGAR